MPNLPTIPQFHYNSLLKAKEQGQYANYICNVPCHLGQSKTFKVKDTQIQVSLKCTQRGGMATGSHCYILPE